MKRFLVLALLAAFVLGAGVANAATTLKTSGEMTFNYGWWDNTNFFSQDDDNGSEDDLMASQRVRAYFDWAASEALRGVLGIEIGTSIWGAGTANNQFTDLDGDERAIEVKHAYMDFTWPNTGLMFRMGLQPVALPGQFGSPVFDADVAGILAQYKFNDMISGAFGWFRLANQNAGGRLTNAAANADAKNDELDAFALLLPIKGDGFEFTPWAMYAIQGANASNTGAPASAGLAPVNATTPVADTLDVWWVGGSFKMTMFAPFTFYADLIYGSQDGSNNSRNDREGWFFDVAADYKMDMVTPQVFFMYATGEDDDLDNGSERMPTVGTEVRGGNALAGNLKFTSFGFGGSASNLSDYDAYLDGSGCSGLWTLGLKLKDFSFLEGLKHTVTVAYGQGTNDSDATKKYGVNAGLTDEDNFWEVDLDSTYAIYENLTAYVEMGYLNVDLDKDTWMASGSTTNPFTATRIDVDKMTAAWKLAVCLRYAF